MRVTPLASDEAILAELGHRLAGARLARNLTQAELAEQAGVSKRTVERLEAGAVATQLSGFLRVCRVLGLVERFDGLIPEAIPSPIERLKRERHKRQRASRKKTPPSKSKAWTWGNET
jgi:transcriptional regulator with XRE-family HTH domain